MTHTTKHTPGPWVVRNRDAVYAQSGRFIADCELTPYGSRPQPPNSTDEANANLIAAAPAMYEALKDALDTIVHMRHYYVGNKLSIEDIQKIVDDGRVALAQADGKA